MEIRLLGAVEVVRHGGRAEGAGRPRQCGVLAALAVDAGRPVPMAMLVDRVWGEHPPERARESLYVYIARLRRLLGNDGQPVRRAGGYALEIDPEAVDVHRFRALVRRAGAGTTGDLERIGLLARALELSRGAALAGVPGGWAVRLRRAWDQERLLAMVEWGRAHLRHGDPRLVTGPLVELAAEHPLSEPVAAVLIEALAASGQAAAALAQYAALRTRLVEELGMEPGGQLRRLHRAVLRGELALPVAAPRPGTLSTSDGYPATRISWCW